MEGVIVPRADAPDVVIQRLPIYLRSLDHLAARDRQVVSSQDLALEAGVSAAQVRKDLSHFGEFGKQGLGYDIAYLRSQLERILHLDRPWYVLIVGAGALGHALVHYGTFAQRNYHIRAVFDNDDLKIGQPIGDGLVVQPMKEMCETIQSRQISIAILAIPASHAQQVAEEVVRCGVRGILNYAPINLAVPQNIPVANLDPVASLQGLSFYL